MQNVLEPNIVIDFELAQENPKSGLNQFKNAQSCLKGKKNQNFSSIVWKVQLKMNIKD